MPTSVMTTYKRLPVTFTHGEGVYLFDERGERYVDALAGIAVCALGHAHPAVTRAVSEQAARLVHTSNLYGIAAQERLAAELTRLSGMERVFFG
ncbi:MAG: aminotransferase class III-fold pyridoxal phosphate-dependent enzyme, partial [Gammaproteobacteria bacterium]|nr:aminotransferase class III-fold pyridoxal phosphate-dependent enzyme [Gammaproteobacteria bacterium]